MILHVLAGIAALSGGNTAISAGDDACWQMIGGAISESARSSHSRYISYAERSAFSVDGKTLSTFDSNITYRDDGMAFIDDNRWTEPMISDTLDPGPPVLGPYGQSRAAWLAMDDDTATKYPVIARVHSRPSESCRDAGIESIANRAFHHLIVGEEDKTDAGLREAWIDPAALDIVRVVIRAPVHFLVRGRPVKALTDYVLEIQKIDGHPVLRHVSWTYRDRESEGAQIAGDFDFNNYRFSEAAPPGTFTASTAQTAAGTRRVTR